MDNATITLLIRYFNILSATVMAFLAIYGVITVFFKSSNLNIFRGRAFIQAFCVAALGAFIIEATYFNYPYYLKYFADGEVHAIGISPQDSTVMLTSDGTLAETIYQTKKDSTTVLSGITFKNLNRRVTSVYIEPIFDTTDELITAQVLFTFDGLKNSITKFPVRGLPNTNYITIHPYGNVSEIQIHLSAKISQLALNKQVPFYFSGLRIFVFSCVFFAFILFFNKRLRAKTAYILFEYKFDPANRRQKIVYAFSVVLLIAFSFICAFTSTSEPTEEEFPGLKQYNKYLVDALIQGRTYLDFGNPEKLLEAEHPYSTRWLKSNGYESNVDWAYDWAWYKGKFYCYFGIVPAVILYAPYKMITGDYLPNHAGIFLFMAISVILLAMLWRHCVMRYMPDATFVFYLLSFLTLFFASGLFGPLRFTRFYSIVSAAGFMFVAAGILLLLKSAAGERPNLLKLFFACLCFALAVGCRPNLAIASLLVPVVMWRYRSFKLAMFILAPYIMVAIPLCFYNYIRFGSITDFGVSYNLSVFNPPAYKGILNPIGKLINTSMISMSYIFLPNDYSIFFPYVECISRYPKTLDGIPKFYDKGCGIINFPIVLCLFCFFRSIAAKNRPETFPLLSVCMIIAACFIVVNSWLIGFSGRYMIDFALFIIIPSVFCAYLWCNGQTCGYLNRLRLKVVYVLLAVSIFVGLFLFAGTITNDVTFSSTSLYFYLQHSLGVLGG
ncbi:MAG: hypothetical protein FWB94_10740 [Chitinispirillia bacterium]|nr:hypothetical protein [Chitinispirillia bacterium]